MRGSEIPLFQTEGSGCKPKADGLQTTPLLPVRESGIVRLVRTFTTLWAAALFLLLASCQTRDPSPSTLQVPPAEQCEASGGSMQPVGLTRSPACVVPTSDGGKRCKDSSECDGRCIVDDWDGDRPPPVGTKVNGTCEASNLTFGCFAEVRRGRIASHFLCVD